MFVDLDALRANGGDELDYRVYVSGDESAITGVAAAYASADVLDKDAFLDVVSTEIDAPGRRNHPSPSSSTRISRLRCSATLECPAFPDAGGRAAASVGLSGSARGTKPR